MPRKAAATMEETEEVPSRRIKIQWTPTVHDAALILKKARQFESTRVGAATIVGMVMKKALKGALVDKETGKSFFE